ncbi:MAG TPA: DUF389 domain-containing protein [Chloroflexi bacterium]|nr:DUF389 domain-containing protein [Chloroflexota bacterium]
MREQQSQSSRRALAYKIGFDPDYLEAFEHKMFIEGPQSARRLTNFFVLLLLAATIATYGLIADSTASVIGAMIVAPLMGPIMATAAAVVMGSAQRALRSLALVVVGVVCVIALSLALTWVVPDVAISFTENGQLSSRIAPGLLSLLTALASGAAGAFITAREEIADSMGGVAIAISLVPPLCVVGIALRVGEFGPASGAMMLFITNFLAILLAGGLTFLLGGLGRLAITDENVRTRRNAFIVVVVATLLIAIPLSVTTYNVVNNALEERAALQEVDAWLDGASYNIIAVNVNDRTVVATVDGYGELPPLKQLAGALAEKLGRPVVVKLRVVPSQLEASD